MPKLPHRAAIQRAHCFVTEQSLWFLAVFISITVVLLSNNRHWQTLELRAFDLITVITSPNEQTTPVFIVGIDDTSIATLGLPWPWPRSIHARLIESLNRAGAAVIAFDVIFEHQSDPAEDEVLAGAIHSAGNVVLGAGLSLEDSAYGILQHRQEPLSLFVKAGAKTGMTIMDVEEDRVVRRLPMSIDSFWRVTLQTLIQRVPALPVVNIPADISYLRYLGPPRTFTYIPYVQALELGNQPNSLTDAIVLVGRSAAITTNISSSQADTFVTPMSWATGSVMSGVEIHATAIENAMRSLTIGPIHPTARWLLITIIAFGSVFSLGNLKNVRNGLTITVGWLMLVCVCCLVLWQYQKLFMPPIALMSIPVCLFMGNVALVANQERENRLKLKRTFSLYLSASVVNEIADDPTKLELGGEQKEITLLFSDLEGFTSLAERLPPRIIANLLNEYFELMTQAVFRHEGTLDKFIGDAVMAFWGAPIPQDDHPRRAVACAKDMLDALDTFNISLSEKGQQPLRMRIGIHTGVAVVGNLGCPSRFSFTALGDTVNLASRIESANKNHGTTLLMSEATARCLPPDIPTKFVEKIQVKGRTEEVSVYTLA